MHCWIDVNKSAIVHNFSLFRGINQTSITAPVLKSNAYGHGLAETYEALRELNPAWICLAYLDEAERLRDLGYQGRLLIVTPVFEDEFARAFELNTDVFLYSHEHLKAWLASKAKPKVHVKIDSGLSRQGILAAEAAVAAEALHGIDPHLVAGLCTHFANVEDVTEHQYANEQLRRFGEAQLAFKAKGFVPMVHAASSASSLILDYSRLDLCRVGIAMYGLWPSAPTRLSYLQVNDQVAELQPALSWRTTISQLKTVSAGDFVGYGCTYRASRAMTLAVLPVGYHEGYPRLAGDRSSYVLVRGQRCPVVGRVSMNLMVCDVTHVQGVAAGQVATLIGRDGDDQVDAGQLATWAETIHYELVAGLHPDIKRRLV